MANAKGGEEKAPTFDETRKDRNAADTRDTNVAAKATPAQDEAFLAAETTVIRADGSTETAKNGDLVETHGNPMGGVTVADVNPAYYEESAAHNGVKE